MKFLCVPCDEPLRLQKTDAAKAGSLNIRFSCPVCGHEITMLTNTGETQLVQSLGVHLGPGEGQTSPMAGLRAQLTGIKAGALTENTAPDPLWTEAAEARLASHPRFVQPIIRKTYTDYARQEGLREITPEVMDAARRVQGSR